MLADLQQHCHAVIACFHVVLQRHGQILQSHMTGGSSMSTPAQLPVLTQCVTRRCFAPSITLTLSTRLSLPALWAS